MLRGLIIVKRTVPKETDINRLQKAGARPDNGVPLARILLQEAAAHARAVRRFGIRVLGGELLQANRDRCIRARPGVRPAHPDFANTDDQL